MAARDEAGTAALLAVLLEGTAGAPGVAARLLAGTFETIAGVLAADADRLAAMVGRDAAGKLKAVEQCLFAATAPHLQAQPVLSDMRALADYLNVRMGHLQVEQLRVLFLDARLRLIRDEVMASGSVSHVPILARPIVRRALDLGASAILVAHNHPSGEAVPSKADIEATRALRRAAQALEIDLVDHVIVTRGEYVSFRAERLL